MARVPAMTDRCAGKLIQRLCTCAYIAHLKQNHAHARAMRVSIAGAALRCFAVSLVSIQSGERIP